MDPDRVVDDERCSDVVLRRQRVRGGQVQLGPTSRQSPCQAGSFGCHMCTQRHPQTGERPLATEARPQQAEHRHGALGELHPAMPLPGEREVGDVVRRQGHAAMLSGGRTRQAWQQVGPGDSVRAMPAARSRGR